MNVFHRPLNQRHWKRVKLRGNYWLHFNSHEGRNKSSISFSEFWFCFSFTSLLHVLSKFTFGKPLLNLMNIHLHTLACFILHYALITFISINKLVLWKLCICWIKPSNLYIYILYQQPCSSVKSDDCSQYLFYICNLITPYNTAFLLNILLRM